MTDNDCQRCGRPTAGVLCAQCMATLLRTLRQLEGLLPELTVAVTRQDNVESMATRVYGRQADVAIAEHAAIPPRLRSPHGRIALVATPWAFSPDMAALLQAVRQDLVLWVRDVSRNRNLGVDRDARLCAWLIDHRADIAQFELAGELMDNLSWHRNRISSAIDRHGADVFLGQCDAAAVKCGDQLYAHAGDKDVRCPTCGWLYSVPRRKAKLLATVYDEIRTVREVADAVTGLLLDDREEPVQCTADMIRGMEHRGRLTYRGLAADGRSQLVKVGDVVELLRKKIERDAARRAKPRKVNT